MIADRDIEDTREPPEDEEETIMGYTNDEWEYADIAHDEELFKEDK